MITEFLNNIQKFFTRAEVDNKDKIVVRIPPSPTGNLNIGTARTALFNYAFAKKHGGTVILRFEDTDKERSKKEFEDNIMEGLTWLGITWDNKNLLRQSERTSYYKLHLEKMIADGTAYMSKETLSQAEGDGDEGKERRSEVIRFKNPNRVVTFTDVVRGEISFDTTELEDFVIAKSLDEPLYHLTVVVDDFEMGITHVIRGEDGISNTPRQILIQEAIGAPRPVYAHLPLVLGKDKSKLSKRHGAKAMLEFRKEGYLPEAIINQLALLGWNPGTDEEFFTLETLPEVFSLAGIQKGGAVFSEEKLQWFNEHYIKELPQDTVEAEIKKRLLACDCAIDDELLGRLTPTITERLSTFGEIETMYQEGEFDYYLQQPDYETESLKWKQSPDVVSSQKHLQSVYDALKDTDAATWSSSETIKEIIWPYAEQEGRGDVLWPYRFALSGKEKSPDPFALSYILGKQTTLERLLYAIEKINQHEKQ